MSKRAFRSAPPTEPRLPTLDAYRRRFVIQLGAALLVPPLTTALIGRSGAASEAPDGGPGPGPKPRRRPKPKPRPRPKPKPTPLPPGVPPQPRAQIDEP